MAGAKDPVRAAITTHLHPVLTAAGFFRRQAKEYVRVRGELVDVIGFQMSQRGNHSFYVHRYINLLSNPLMNIHAYRVGRRLDRDPLGSVAWEGASEVLAQRAVASVAAAAVSEMVPWFDGIDNLERFVVEYVAAPDSRLEEIELAIALLRLGHLYRPWWSCQALLDAAEQGEDAPFLVDEETADIARQLQRALDSDAGYISLLEQWRAQNISRYHLAPCLGDAS